VKTVSEDPEIHERLAAPLQELRAILQIDETTEWRLVNAWSKRKKVLFELEEKGHQQRRTLVGRLLDRPPRADRNRACYRALEVLWAAGLRPPCARTVPQPIGHSANWQVILQEKAPGDLLDNLFVRDAGTARRSAAMAGEWLNALHSLPLEFSEQTKILPKLDIWSAALKQLSPQHSTMLERIHQQIAAQLLDEPANAPAPSHGDFHATNILISDTGRVTGIDFDNFGGRERAADLGYFLGQTAARGFRKTGSFGSTAEVRAAFIQNYAAAAGLKMPPRLRVGSHAGAAFLRLLHDELCLMKSGRTDLIDPWLTAAELSASGAELATG
jgi:aminoglycoside phosphotransferase (APT) family kinase protein